MASELIELSGHIIDSWTLPRSWDIIMDRGGNFVVVVDLARGRAYGKPMHEVQVGELVVVGHDGIRVQPFERAREREAFAFMQSDVSSEKVKVLAIHEIARRMKETRTRNGKILFVLGPAVIHTGAGRYVAELIRRDYVQVIFGGNAIVTHDVEAALFGTSLGVDLRSGEQVEGGHRNHLRAINAIRAVGSLEKALETGLLREGLTYEAMKRNIPMVLAGSIRDDGPMPGVVNDMQEAQRRMRKEVKGVEMALMIASMLHAIATGNLLPSTVRTVVVDINPAVVTKLADRGSFQAAAVVTDAELFLRELVDALE